MSDRQRDRANEEEEDDEWLFDSIVGYLSSPIWKVPVEHFFEQNCSIFSPEETEAAKGSAASKDSSDSDEGNIIPAEYLEAHIKYKNLVDALINSFLQDIGVSYKQFLRACKKSTRFTQQPVYLELFEQIWCTENINIFKSQMIKKNVELELQALLLLQFQLGMAQKDMRAFNDGDEIMAIVIQKSRDEYERGSRATSSEASSQPAAINKSEMEMAKKIVCDSDHIERSLQYEIDQQAYLNRKMIKHEIKQPGLETTGSSSEQARPASAAKRPESARKNLTSEMGRMSVAREGQSRFNEASSNEFKTAHLKTGEISEAELRRRAEFMEKQRDILTEKKRVERQKQLEQYMRQEQRQGGAPGGAGRPMSSRAARSVLRGAEAEDIPQAALNAKSASDEERKRAEARRALAETLKKEVINQSHSQSRKGY